MSSLTDSDRIREALPAVAGFGLPFALIVYLAIQAGGYDPVIRGQTGVILWWVILLGLVFGILPATRVTRAGWIGMGLLAALALWTGLATLIWTESAERGVAELGRVFTLLGALTLFVLIQGREGQHRTIAAVGAAVGVIAAVALASRFEPGWFPVSEIPADYPVARLNHPLEYWNALAAFLAMGVAPLIWTAAAARTIVVRALAAGAVPLVLLACYLTASRGGAIAMAVSLLALVALHPRRISLLPTALTAGIGSGILFLLIEARPELRDLGPGEAAASQGTEMLWLTLAVFVLVAVLQAALALAVERRRIVLPEPSHGAAKATGLVCGLIVVATLFTALGTGWAGDRWAEFKEPAPREETVSRLGNLGSGERYEVWDAAVAAGASERLTGIGPGTFEYWWAREGGGTQFVRDAHSLYLEALAEMGPVGFLLVLALILTPIGIAGTRAVRRGSDGRRARLAAAAAAMLAFAVAAGIDWAWEMTVLPVLFLILAAAVFGPDGESRRGRKSSRFTPVPFDLKTRLACCLAAGIALIAVANPLAATQMVRESQELFREGDLESALDKAEQATGIQPFSATALDQKALVLEAGGRPGDALGPAEEATRRESANWRTWFVLESVQRSLGDEAAADRAAERARQLNTRSPLLGTGPYAREGS